MSTNDSVVPADLRESVLDTLASNPQKTLSPREIALAVSPGENWLELLTPIRRAAIELALAGRLVIYRKGKPADPNDFKGVYRLGLPRHD